MVSEANVVCFFRAYMVKALLMSNIMKGSSINAYFLIIFLYKLMK